jgi:ParB family chromosome partitioning protein
MTKRMGRGFAEILESSRPESSGVMTVPVSQIKPGRYQPRQDIDEAALKELADSIKSKGVIQPLIVRPIAHGVYELVAGERRWRAAQAAGLAEVPVLVRALSDQETLEYSLIENLQRDDLNPIEEARGYARLMEEFSYSQEQLAERLGKDRSTVANALRVLKLPEEIQRAVRRGTLSQGHAKVLAGLEDRQRQLALFGKAVAEHLSVRQLEALVGATALPRPARRRRGADPHLAALEDALRTKLGTKVTLLGRKKGGRVIIEYFSTEDLARLLELLGVMLSDPS